MFSGHFFNYHIVLSFPAFVAFMLPRYFMHSKSGYDPSRNPTPSSKVFILSVQFLLYILEKEENNMSIAEQDKFKVGLDIYFILIH